MILCIIIGRYFSILSLSLSLSLSQVLICKPSYTQKYISHESYYNDLVKVTFDWELQSDSIHVKRIILFKCLKFNNSCAQAFYLVTSFIGNKKYSYHIFCAYNVYVLIALSPRSVSFPRL